MCSFCNFHLVLESENERYHHIPHCSDFFYSSSFPLNARNILSKLKRNRKSVKGDSKVGELYKGDAVTQTQMDKINFTTEFLWIQFCWSQSSLHVNFPVILSLLILLFPFQKIHVDWKEIKIIDITLMKRIDKGNYF